MMSESAACLPDYERVPIAFEVTERLEVSATDVTSGRLNWQTRAVHPPYVKDYDVQPGQRPSEWAQRWDLSNWWFAAAFVDDRRVGGVAVIVDPGKFADAAPTAGPFDAFLWDIRVAPDCRGRGVGRQLLAFAESHARASGRRRMAVETQDINVAACRFYAGAGFALVAVDPHAYPALPDEVQLIWRKDLL